MAQGAWWLWATILATKFRHTTPVYDWTSSGFGAAFGVYIFLTIGFQVNYLFLCVHAHLLLLKVGLEALTLFLQVLHYYALGVE